MTSIVPVKLAFNAFEPEGGASDKPPVIFAHGLTASKECWSNIPQTVANATKRRVYTVDSRNHGDNEWIDEWSFDHNVDDLLHFMDSIDAPKVIILGHSMGGITGMHLSLRCPERVEKLVVEDISIRKVSKQSTAMLSLFLSLCTKATEEMPTGLDENSAYTFMTEYVVKHLPPEIKAMRKSEPRTYPNSGLLKPTEDGRFTFKANMSVLLKALQSPETLVSEPKGICEAPTCFIYGTISDYPVLQDADHIKQYFPKAEFFGITDATHIVHGDCPQEFTNTLLKFLLKE